MDNEAKGRKETGKAAANGEGKFADPIRRISSVDLLGAQGELVILHQGREYRLRVTRNEKLILTA